MNEPRTCAVPTQFSNSATGTGTYIYTDPNFPRTVINASAPLVIDSANITARIAVDRSQAIPGDLLTYTIAVHNNAAKTITDVCVTDDLPEVLSPVAGSFEPALQPGENLSRGINLGSVPAGGSKTLRFAAALGAASCGTVENAAVISYRMLDSSGRMHAFSAPTNTVSTEVIRVCLTLSEAISQQRARPGDTVQYAITACNQSTVPLTNIRITDPSLHPSLTVSNLRLCGRPVPAGQDLSSGVVIAALSPGQSAPITFDVRISENAPDVVQSAASAGFYYAIGGATQTGSATAKPALLPITRAVLSISKTADKAVVSLRGETVTYTVTVKNTGNVTLDGVTVVDPIPSGMEYKPNSTRIGSSSILQNCNPADGILIGSLSPGESLQIVFCTTVTF